MKIERRYWPLVVLATLPEGERRLTPMQLQKTLFLIGKNIGAAVGRDYYDFVPYLYGPFAKAINQDVSDLVEEGLVTAVPGVDRTWNSYELSASGMELGSLLKGKLPPSACEYAKVAVHWVRTTSVGAMLRAIYEKYPEYAQKSVARLD